MFHGKRGGRVYIKQWLQDDMTKKQCEILIDHVIWKLIQQGSIPQQKTIEKRRYEGSDIVYQQLLEYKFDDALEARFAQQGRIQDVMREDGIIEKGLDHDAALSVFSILTHLVVNKYVSNVQN